MAKRTNSIKANVSTTATSKARESLTENLKDVRSLLELHEEKGGANPGRRTGLEVLNKSAIVLLTSHWEAYCEDLAEEGLEHIVTHAKTSDVLPKAIKKIIASNIDKDKNELACWSISDDKWRDVLRANLVRMKDERNRNLNTPKWSQVDTLFEASIGLTNISSKWVWAKKLTAAKARQKLNKFVELRGEIAHRGRATTPVHKVTVSDYLDFVENAASKTGEAVNAHVKNITSVPLFGP